jgi:hypothetical protein
MVGNSARALQQSTQVRAQDEPQLLANSGFRRHDRGV